MKVQGNYLFVSLLLSLLFSTASFGQTKKVTRNRTCSVCQQSKPISDFSGDSKTCKTCVKKTEDRRKEEITRQAREKAEKERIAKEQAEQERILREQLEKERIAKEEARRQEEIRQQEEQRRHDKLKREQAEKEGYVDLGLPSGTLWAIQNIGASKPEEIGDYFAWGETKGYKSGKKDFSWRNYKWSGSNSKNGILTKYCSNSKYGKKGFTDNKRELDLEDDAAYVNLGSKWRIPSKAQTDELREKCDWKWMTFKGTEGYMIKGPNGNTLFLPAAGWRLDSSLADFGKRCHYWTRSLSEEWTITAYYLCRYPTGSGKRHFFRECGFSIRPVRNM